MKHQRSPFAPSEFPAMPPIAGVKMAAAASGIKAGKLERDLLLMHFQPGSMAAGVFTASSMAAAPIRWCQTSLERSGGAVTALVLNSGNANAHTGARGEALCRTVAGLCSRMFGCPTSEVLIGSTGVIGEPLAERPFKSFLPRLEAGLSAHPWDEAAQAIMTTDTYAKGASTRLLLDGEMADIAGIAKGSGMIAPNMATLLGVVVTTVPIAAPLLDTLLRRLTDRSFNAISVDSDTSTNDMVLLVSTGAARIKPIEDEADPRLKPLEKALEATMVDLARQVVRDGEGISKQITVSVEGARDTAQARQIAMSVANSPLVKTAVAGGDANWGRIIMAIGKSGVDLKPEDITLHIGQQQVTAGGARAPRYREEVASAHFAGDEVEITIQLPHGNAAQTVWASDLTHQYIDINASYRS